MTTESEYIPTKETAYSRPFTAARIDLSDKDHLHLALPPLDIDEAVVSKWRTSRGPVKVGIHRDVLPAYKGNLANVIQWEQTAGGFTGTLKIHSPNAKYLRIAMSAKLPRGSSVVLYKLDESDIGSDPIDVAFDGEVATQGLRWLPTTQGSRAALQITAPTFENVDLRINQVAHRVSHVKQSTLLELDGCQNHRNAACTASEDRYAESSSTVMLIFEQDDGTYSCSGVQMNDQTEDSYIPFILTAEHCISDQVVADTIETHFNFRYSECDEKIYDEDYFVNYGGAYLLEAVPQQDMSLIKLKRANLLGSWFAGWSFSSTQLNRGSVVYSFHHPLGQEQKVSDGAIDSLQDVHSCDEDGDCQLVSDAIRVAISDGTTEAGSSGSGLFAAEGYLLGILTSGPNECENSEHSYGSLNQAGRSISKWLANENNDDHGDEEATATHIDRNDSLRGSLETSTDSDYFRIDVHHHGTLDLYTTGDVDTYGTLYDDERSYNDDDGGDGTNFRLTQDVERGIYHVRVKPYDSTSELGQYRLFSEFSLADIGDSWQKSYRLLDSFNYIEAGLENEGDIDWYVLNLEDKGTLKVLSVGTTDTQCSILPAQNTGLSPITDDDSGILQNCRLEMTVFPSTFYVRVQGHDESVTGDYGVFIFFEHMDDHASDAEYATRIESESDNWNYVTTAHMGDGDTDMFRVTLRFDGNLMISSDGPLDLTATLMDEDEEVIAFNDDSGNAKNFSLTENLTAGDYFIKVQGYFEEHEGDYDLSIGFRETF